MTWRFQILEHERLIVRIIILGIVCICCFGCEYIHIRDAWLFYPHNRWITDSEMPSRRFIMTTWEGTTCTRIVYAFDEPIVVVCLRDFSGPTQLDESLDHIHRDDQDIEFLAHGEGTLEPFEVPDGKRIKVEGIMMTRLEPLGVRTHVGGDGGGTTCALNAPVNQRSREPLNPPSLPSIVCRRIYELQPDGNDKLIWETKGSFVID